MNSLTRSIPTDTETDQTKAKVAKREAQIEALERKSRHMGAALEAESEERRENC